jgi:uncharacterized protein
MLANIQYQSIELPPSTSQIVLMSDTHTTNRSPHLHPNLIPTLVKIHPDIIFHAGDICLPSTLVALNSLAPVIAVRGNRDLTGLTHLPEASIIHLHQHRILLTHGHAPLIHYLIDKLQYLQLGFRYARYHEYLTSFDEESQLFLFGHTHVAFQLKVGSRQFINPGSTCYPNPHDPFPSLVKLTVSKQAISSEFIYL